jgi:hypothetical protein
MKQFLVIIVLAVVASVCGAQQTAPVIVKTVPAVEHIYTCPAGYTLNYFVKALPTLLDNGAVGTTGIELYQDRYVDAPVSDIIRSDAPICLAKQKTVKTALPQQIIVLPKVEHRSGESIPAEDQVEVILQGVGKRLLVRLKKSKFSLSDQAVISVMVRSAMEDYKQEAVKDGVK